MSEQEVYTFIEQRIIIKFFARGRKIRRKTVHFADKTLLKFQVQSNPELVIPAILDLIRKWSINHFQLLRLPNSLSKISSLNPENQKQIVWPWQFV